MAITNIKQLAEDVFGAWNSHDIEKITSFLTDDCVWEDLASSKVARGKEEIEKFFKESFVWSPDYKLELKSVFSAGDRAASEWVMTGTNEGEMGGLPATGKKFSVRGASFTEWRGDKICRNSDYYNLFTILLQIGLLGGPPRK